LAFQSSLPFDAVAPRGENLSWRSLAAPSGHWDELHDGATGLRAPWRRFFGLLGDTGLDGLAQLETAMQRQIRDNDITYNVYADNGRARAWALELLPLLVDEPAWRAIERGVIQRASLMNAIAADVYGAQSLLQRGLLPPALVFGHPGYLRPVRGFVPPGGQYLHVVAVDLARTPDGGWTVLAHRTEAPSGIGYALENRIIVSGLFPDAFREMRVRRLAPAFSRLIDTLVEAAPRAAPHDGESNIVLLTPGPYNETYFEHAFLARYLGITLAEGKDLTVRDDRLYLKTLAGLERVDVVLRRLDDAYCDPVELRPDSAIGVPGLLQVMRAGNVLVSNVPGAGFLESPALHAFLPAIARLLLGEELALPSVSTWWCGEATARTEAFARLADAFLMPSWPLRAGEPRLGLEQGLQRLADWRERIEQTPDAYVIQAPLPPSYAPRFEGDLIGHRAAALRAYAIADGRGGWHVMPGGFTRLAAARRTTVSMQLGGSSTDTWVMSSEPTSTFTLLPAPLKPADLSRKHRPVSSRAAENLFWSGRYGERAENSVRLCRLILGSFEDGDSNSDAMLATLGELAVRCGLVPPNASSPRDSARVFERTLIAALDESAGTTSIGQNLACHAQAAGEIRSRLANDHWRTIIAARNDWRDALTHHAPEPDHGQYDRLKVMAALEHLAMQLQAISGAHGDRMTRDEAWRLLFIGRHIERVSAMAMFLLTVIEQRTMTTREGFALLLQLFDSTLTYRSMFPGRVEIPALIDLIVIEPTNPRSLYGVVERLRGKLAQIPSPTALAQRTPLPELLPSPGALPTLDALCASGDAGRFTTLAGLCERVIDAAIQLSNEISARYFSHASAAASQVT
jgi:uncharacterized circularly permuted ATP-grasp superfamily protein/uncharacterized alpha-E superfamily protein